MNIVMILELLPVIFLTILGFVILMSANLIIPNITQKDYICSFLMFIFVFVSVALYAVIKENK